MIITKEILSEATRLVGADRQKDYGDKEALEFLSKNCDAITYEFENIPVESLSFLNKDISINPSPYILSISQNRLNEKTLIKLLASIGYKG